MKGFWRWIEWAVALIILALLLGIAWALINPAQAEETSKSLTGIPVEYLFAAIGTLVSLVYMDMRRAISALKHEAGKRGRHIRHVENAVRLICNKLKINYEDTDND